MNKNKNLYNNNNFPIFYGRYQNQGHLEVTLNVILKFYKYNIKTNLTIIF